MLHRAVFKRGRRARLVALGLTATIAASVLALVFALVLALGARGTTTRTAAAPTKQFSDRFETSRHEQLAALFDTGLEGGHDELWWGIAILPCQHRRYRLIATEAAIASVYSSSTEVEVSIGWAHLARGLRCGLGLPHGVHEDKASLSVLPLGGAADRHPSSVYEDSETTIKSFVACVTLAETCPGRYIVRAALVAPGHRRLLLEYSFTVAFVGRGGRHDGAASGGQRIGQCPIA